MVSQDFRVENDLALTRHGVESTSEGGHSNATSQKDEKEEDSDSAEDRDVHEGQVLVWTILEATDRTYSRCEYVWCKPDEGALLETQLTRRLGVNPALAPHMPADYYEQYRKYSASDGI